MNQKIRIGEKEISEESEIFFIAEMAGSHNGSLDLAEQLIKIAANSKADGIKLHMYKPEDYITPQHKIYDLIKKLAFTKEEWTYLFKTTKESGLKTIAVAADKSSLKWALELNTDAIFIYPACVDDEKFLKESAKSKKPIFIQTGGATFEEIKNAVEIIKKEGNDQIILIHGYQAFPTKLEDIKLNYLESFKEKFNVLVGIEDHTQGDSELAKIIPFMALPYNVCCISKHFTIDRDLKITDYESALNPPELKNLVKNIKEAKKALGPKEIELSEDEKKYRRYVKKSIVADRDIKINEVIKEEDIAFKRAPNGILPSEKNKVIGSKAKKDFNINDVICLEDINY